MHASSVSSQKSIRRITLFALFALALALVLPAARPAQAVGPILVNNLSGVIGGDANNGTCTLYEAIQAANNDSAYDGCAAGSSAIPDLITFGVSGVITLQGGLNINTNIAILGPIAISGNQATRMFTVSGNGTLSLSLMTLQKGKDAGGGAILVNGGTLNIAGVDFDGNEATSNGGAINSTGVLNIAAAHFVGNKAAQEGGAIYASGGGNSVDVPPLTLAASVFNGNSAGTHGGAVFNTNSNRVSVISDVIFNGSIVSGSAAGDGGGAIYHTATGSDDGLKIIRSVFNGNLAPGANGGAIFANSGGTLTISDSSFQGNLSGTPPATSSFGGAIYNLGKLDVLGSAFLNNAVAGSGGALANDKSGQTTVSNTSFTANAAADRGGALFNGNSQPAGSGSAKTTTINATFSQNAAPDGGTIHNQASYVVEVRNTIIASDAGTCNAVLVATGNNLQFPGSNCGGFTAADPLLDFPFFNGGPIASLLTQKLKPGSAAIDAGDPAICAAAPVSNVDQRGKARPKDGDGDGTATCDIGSFEGDTVVAGYGSTPVQPGPISFGNSVINPATPLVAGLSIFETGNKALQVSNPIFGGSNPGDFAIKAPSPFPLTIADDAAAQNVQITCAPTAVGQRSATLTLTTNDPSHLSVSYTLNCTGTAAPVPGYGSTPAAPGPIDFGNVNLGSSVDAAFQIQETGNAQLQVSNPVFGGSNPGDFVVKAPSPFPINIDDNTAAKTVQLTCTPAGLGIRTATLTLTTNDPSTPTVSYNLACSGVPVPPLVLAAPGQSIGDNTIPGMNAPYGIAVSPDGAFVYAAGEQSDSVSVFKRDVAGTLTLVQSLGDANGDLNGARMVLVSQDGENVYVAASIAGTVVAYSRDTSSGLLTKINRVKDGDAYGCFPGPCAGNLTLAGAYGLAISPDGQYIYASGISANSIVVFFRNQSDGGLRNIFNSPTHVQTYTNITDLNGAYGIALSPDGSHLYATGYSSSTLLMFNRNASNGKLTFVEKQQAGGAGGIAGLSGVFRVTASPDGAYVYTASFDSDSVTAFRRNVADGKLTHIATYTDGVGGVDGLDATTAVAVSPNGKYLFATGYYDKAVAVFDRDPTTGLLSFNQVIKRNPPVGGPAQPLLDGARDVAVSPDGRMIFATGFIDDRVVALPLANPIPALTSLEPSSAAAGGAAFTLKVNGAGFVPGATVKWGGSDRTTTFVNDSQLTASIAQSDIAAAGSVNITVVNPGPGGGASTNALPFTITAPSDKPVPSLRVLIPAGANAGGPAFTLTVEGSNFIHESKIRWNGADRASTYVSGTQLQATIGAADIAQAGPAGVTVFNPGPGGGTSNALTFTVVAPGQNPRPSITSLVPPSINAGSATGAGLTLIIGGVGFIEDSQAQWNGDNRPTTFVSSSQLSVTLTAGDLANASQNSVTVVNPGPGGGTSNTATFIVNQPGDNPVPSLTRYSLTLSGGNMTMLIGGANFINGSTLFSNGTALPTTFISSTQLSVTLPAVQITQGGPASLIAVNPGPGGGESNTLLFRLGTLHIALARR